MVLKTQSAFRRRFIKVSLVVISIFVVGFTCLYIWFVHNSNELLINLVDQKSAGKLKLTLSSVSFDFFSAEIKIHKAAITSTNKDKLPITYKASFLKVVLHTNSIWSLLLRRSLEIRQIKLYDPTIEVFNRQKDSSSDSKSNLSLGMELGKMYNSVQDAITALNTRSISIINAKLILNNKTATGGSPVIFSHIYFTLKKLNKHRKFPGGYLDNNNIIFSSFDQDISLTDGIHKLQFKKLVVQQAKSIILDSCTIVALPTKTSANSYHIYFKRLALIGVDFNALYKANLIRADSVYCENPVSNINLNANLAGAKVVARGMPNLEKIIQEFSGNLDLGFVGIKDADIHVNITGKRGRSNINYGKANFQIKNLRISPDSSKLISIKSFDMIIRGYNLYNADSSCIYSFDSIRFANDKLLLNNFSVHTSSGINSIRNYRDYSMPYFELLGLNWPELIFKQNLKATEAILHDPTINFIKTTKAGILKKSFIFNSNHTFDDFMEIGRLKILNGKININWGNHNFLQLQGLNLSLLPNNLKSYTDVKLQKDVESLFFSGGYLKIGDIEAQLQNVTFKANDQVYAREVKVNSSLGGIDSKINDVSIKNIYTEPGNNVVIDGLEWKRGDISISPVLRTKTNSRQASFLLRNISGKQTQFKFSYHETEGNVFVEDAAISTLVKDSGKAMMAKGFKIRGKNMNFSNTGSVINSASFFFSDTLQELSGTRVEHVNKTGTVNITTPFMQVTGNSNSFFDSGFHLSSVLIKSPVINFYKQDALPAAERKSPGFPAMRIDHIAIEEPVIHVKVLQPSPGHDFMLPYSKGSEIKFDNVLVARGGVTVGTVDFKSKKAEISKGTEKVLKIDNGIDLNLSKINISLAGDSLSWNAMVNKLNVENSEGFTFNIKDNKLELKDLALGNGVLSSSLINDLGKLVNANRSAWIGTSALKYYSKNSLWQCFNVNYNASRGELMVDSLNYHPAILRDEAIAANPYQIDYINFHSGNTSLYGFDLIKYFNNDSLIIQKVTFGRPSIFVYRDKFPPFLSGVRKQLFIEQVRSVRQPVSINQIEIEDGSVSYTERNGKTRLEGNLLLTSLHGSIFNIKNFDITKRDSLSVALTGHLLNTAFFDLRLNQSYPDPLYGFVMALKIEPAPLIFLNPLLAPLSNIKFVSGTIDKFDMNAVGNENFAQGKMNFYYHGLKIQLLKNGEMGKTTFARRAASVAVNAFVLKTNNNARNGLIYFKRLKDRSFFNYMNKIIFSGISTSVGAKNNSRYKKNIAHDAANKNGKN